MSVALPWRAARRHNGLNAAYKKAGGRRWWLASSNACRRGVTRVVGGREEEEKIQTVFCLFFHRHYNVTLGSF